MKAGKVFLKGRAFQKVSTFLLATTMIFTLGACGSNSQKTENLEIENKADEDVTSNSGTDGNAEITDTAAAPPENFAGQNFVGQDFVLIEGGTLEMGSPDTEAWRSKDEVRHTVTVSDFYMGIYEVRRQSMRR